MSDIEKARQLLAPYTGGNLRVANPLNVSSEEWHAHGIQDSRRLEAVISLNVPSAMGLSGTAVRTAAGTADYWTRGGAIVVERLTTPLTCPLFAHLVVHALSQATRFDSRIEVVQIQNTTSRLVDNHYIVVVGRTGGDITDDPSTWGADAFVVDLWGAAQGLGAAIAHPAAIIVTSMTDTAKYTRKVVATIPPWDRT